MDLWEGSSKLIFSEQTHSQFSLTSAVEVIVERRNGAVSGNKAWSHAAAKR